MAYLQFSKGPDIPWTWAEGQLHQQFRVQILASKIHGTIYRTDNNPGGHLPHRQARSIWIDTGSLDKLFGDPIRRKYQIASSNFWCLELVILTLTLTSELDVLI